MNMYSYSQVKYSKLGQTDVLNSNNTINIMIRQRTT